MAQATDPWQLEGRANNFKPLPPLSSGGIGMSEQSKKRQRSDDNAIPHEHEPKRQQTSTNYHPSGIPLPQDVNRGPVEVISLLDDDDDDDDVPSAPVAKAYPRAQPYPQAQSYAQAQPYVQAQQYPQAKPYPQSQPYPQGQTYPSPAAQYQSQPPGLYAGSYAQPFEIDALQAPPPVPQYTPIYNPVDQRQSQVSYSDFHGQFVELDAPQPSPLSQTHNSEHGYFTPEWKTEQLEAHMEAYPDDPLAGPKLKEAWLANLRYKEAQERDTHMRQQTSSTPPKSSSSFKKLDLAQYRRQEPKTAAADIVPIVEPTLCKEQADLVGLILSRTRNVFYTGSAGCGKSTVLKAFVKRFEAQGMKVNILAPTGRAALDINGTTTWTYAGWTPDHHKKPLKELKAGAHGKFVRKRLCETDVLVLDEISMIENLHLERLNAVMKEARNSDKAFGGVQLVVTGDFCQLPPVRPFGHCIECGRDLIKNREETEYKCRNHGTYYDLDKWAFRSEAWKECDFVHVNLTTIHRQSDKVFIDILNDLRMGIKLSQANVDLLLDHPSETRGAIRLFATRLEVKRINDEKFAALRSTAREYRSYDHFKWNEKHGNLKNKGDRGPDGSLIALREHRFEANVQLKKGMLVVLLYNLDLPHGLVNGSQGTIQGFEDFDPAKLPKAATNRRGAEDTMMPGVQVLQGDLASFQEDQIKQYARQMTFNKWPVVRFLNGVERTIYANCTVNSIGDDAPHSLLSRTQIPLMAAWAMTTHKSQGMTLNRVVVDLSKSFETGQAYVALSRARSLEGLKVESFPPTAQGTGNPQVKEFLREKFGIGAQ